MALLTGLEGLCVRVLTGADTAGVDHVRQAAGHPEQEEEGLEEHDHGGRELGQEEDIQGDRGDPLEQHLNIGGVLAEEGPMRRRQGRLGRVKILEVWELL